MAKKNCIVITSIYPASKAVKKFSRLKDYDLIIVGDKKSPKIYNVPAIYLDVEGQSKKFPKMAALLPYNHYCRKNLGYIYALQAGYEIIADSDDDNIPYKNWGQFPTAKQFETIVGPLYPNVYKAFTKEPVWPRGYPVDQITKNLKLQTRATTANVMVWQSLADGSPDVDAIYRLVNGKDITFRKRRPLVLKQGLVCAFNSQNTLWQKQAFVYLYLPHTVTFRYTDILRSFVAQFGIWKLNGQLGFTEATVEQDRNAHNLIKDFRDEIPMYLTFYEVIEVLKQCRLTGTPKDLLIMYQALYNKGIVKRAELTTVRSWNFS
jgi:hypothetical protein